jgi:polysaccharide deacetylase 2 family uncharacterized protein YibQ
LVECKAYKRPVSVDDLLIFAERIDDIGANKGIIITLHGFQPGAVKVAESHGIALALAIPHRETLDFVRRLMPDLKEAKAIFEGMQHLARAFKIPIKELVHG